MRRSHRFEQLLHDTGELVAQSRVLMMAGRHNHAIEGETRLERSNDKPPAAQSGYRERIDDGNPQARGRKRNGASRQGGFEDFMAWNLCGGEQLIDLETK